MPVTLPALKPSVHTYVRPQVREIPRRLEAVTRDSFGGPADRRAAPRRRLSGTK